MTKALDLIDAAHRHLRGKDAPITALDRENSLGLLNAMMASRAADISTLGTTTQLSGDVTGTYPITIGSGGDIDVARPVTLLSVAWRHAVGGAVSQYGMTRPLPRLHILPLVSYEYYYTLLQRRFSDPNTPVCAYYLPEYPLGLLHLWPEPTQGKLGLHATTARYQWATLSTDVSLPPALQFAIEYQLALDLAGQYQVSAGAELAAKAQSAWDRFALTAEVAA